MMMFPKLYNDLVLVSLTTGWRMCMAYRKLNSQTEKYHFPMSLMDQIFEKLD